MSKLSIKRIRRLIYEEKPKAIARYLKQFLPADKRNLMEIRLDEYAHDLVENKYITKVAILKKLEELSDQC